MFFMNLFENENEKPTIMKILLLKIPHFTEKILALESLFKKAGSSDLQLYLKKAPT